ncbi:MAG: Peptidase inhibitor family [Actinoplanes sp.]|nr:Peptidase inhibitor family [Actinoplanes sp.]
MRIRKAPAVAAATLLVAAGVTLANSGVAQAADCPNNVLCLYENPSWGGNVMIITGPTTMLEGFNDKTSSFSNHTNTQWCLFEHRDFEGRKLVVIPPWTAWGDFLPDADDRASSITGQPAWC